MLAGWLEQEKRGDLTGSPAHVTRIADVPSSIMPSDDSHSIFLVLFGFSMCPGASLAVSGGA